MNELTSNNIIDVVNALIGQTEPYGSSEVDAKRLKNIVKLINLTSWCLDEIIKASKYEDSPYASMADIGNKAYKAIEEYKHLLEAEIPT